MTEEIMRGAYEPAQWFVYCIILQSSEFITGLTSRRASAHDANMTLALAVLRRISGTAFDRWPCDFSRWPCDRGEDHTRGNRNRRAEEGDLGHLPDPAMRCRRLRRFGLSDSELRHHP